MHMPHQPAAAKAGTGHAPVHAPAARRVADAFAAPAPGYRFDQVAVQAPLHTADDGSAAVIRLRTGATGPIIQRDVVDDARDALSYGVFDWAITDAEALDVLAKLGSIPAADLPAALNRLGSKYITRLLDNLPDAAKTGDIYKRLVEALGVQGVLPYTEDLLSYGLFDWAVTDAEVSRVFNTLITLPPAAQEAFLVQLNNMGRLKRLVANATTGHHALYIRPWIAALTRGALTPDQRHVLRSIVEETSNDAFDTLKLATEIRFNVTVRQATIPGNPPVDWEPGALRRTYLTLDLLPEAHVAGNKELLAFGQYKLPAADNLLKAGVYSSSRRELDINTEGDDIETIIHETGHAVDQAIGWTVGPEPAKPKRGGWKSYGVGYNAAATEMVDDSGGGIKTQLTPPQRTDVENEMATAMANRSATGLESRIRRLPWFGGLPGAAKGAVIDDHAIEALRVGLNVPWFRAAAGGEHLGDHVYQESYPSTWVRYRHEARARMVSQYQFRDPGEWFAEAYAYYYLPDKRGKGARLNDKDSDTKSYFDTVVDPTVATR